DELSTSPPAVQAAMLGVALERRVGDLLLPRAVQVVAAANPPERAADGWDLSPPLANRFLHIAYTPDTDGWIDGMTAGFSLPASGLVGEGAAVEYLTWRREADLPDPAQVVADPTGVAWRSLDPSRVWAILAGVVGHSAGRGTVEAWRAGWGPLAVAAEMGKGDV